MLDFEQLNKKIISKVHALCMESKDSAHDFLHFQRVVSSALKLAKEESASMEVVIPAAWLHDFVNVPKNDPRRSQASQLSAEAATQFLREIHYPSEYLTAIYESIECHSFSAQKNPKILEAKIIQDADRLDALGAIGIARCFATGGVLNRAFYAELDPFCENRQPDDMVYTLDHFYKKLLLLPDSFQTAAGKKEALRRVEYMHQFLREFKTEIEV